MSFLKKQRVTVLIFLGIAVLFFLLRLPNLTLQPIFADEAIYIRWAQLIRAVPSLRFVPLQDGKTPLYMWSLVPFLKVFSDPLFAGRLLSVLSGFGTLLGAGVLGWKFFSKRVGVLSTFLIAITPIFVFFDRMALVDSMLACFSVWSLFLALWLVRSSRLDLSMFLGYALGASWLTKTPGVSNIVCLPVLFIYFPWSSKPRMKNFVKTVSLFIFSGIVAYTIFNILRLGPEFDKLSSRDNDYLFPLSKIIHTPTDPLLPHLSDLGQWCLYLVGLPLCVFILAGIYRILARKNRVGIILILWTLIPLLVELFLIKAYTARYILYILPPVIIIASYGIEWVLEKFVKKKAVWIILALFLMSWSAFFDLRLLTDPTTAPLPYNEAQGYLRDWTAGYGFADIADSINQISQTQPVVIASDGSFGTLPDGLEIYLDQNKNVSFIVGKQISDPQVLQAAKDHLTFYITDKSRFPGAGSNDELIKFYPKPKDKRGFENAILLFEVHPLTQ